MRVGVRAGCRKVARAGPEKNDTTAVRRWRFISQKVRKSQSETGLSPRLKKGFGLLNL